MHEIASSICVTQRGLQASWSGVLSYKESAHTLLSGQVQQEVYMPAYGRDPYLNVPNLLGGLGSSQHVPHAACTTCSWAPSS